MKSIIRLIILIILLILPITTYAGQPFAVVELFTSQGCSSCPPADAFLKQLSAVAREQKKRIFPLSFHVDYWNKLGWEDPYSNSDFTYRQNLYAKAFKKNNVYTPQMVINGKYEFGGYKQDIAKNYINAELASQPTPIVLSFKPEYIDKNTLKIQYTVTPLLKNGVINVAIAERNMGNDVPKGENAGKHLSHENVVRAFHTKDLNAPNGTITLKIPDGLNLDQSTAVVYIQHNSTMRVLSVEMADLYTPDAFKNLP